MEVHSTKGKQQEVEAGTFATSISKRVEESEAVESFLALRRLEPRSEGCTHASTLRLGYGGVIWCATTLGLEGVRKSQKQLVFASTRR